MSDDACRHGYIECATCQSDREHEEWVLRQWPFDKVGFGRPIVRAIAAEIVPDGQLIVSVRFYTHRRWLSIPGDWWRSHSPGVAVAAQMMWYRLIRDTIADVLNDIGMVLEHAEEKNTIPGELDALRIQLRRCRLDPSQVTSRDTYPTDF